METFNWKKQLFEVIVLIVGILIAFGLNNWWSQRKEAMTLQKHYINLEEESKDNRVMLVPTANCTNPHKSFVTAAKS